MACSSCQLTTSYKSGVEGRMEMLSTHDWLSDIPSASHESNIVEVRFKGTHKAFFKNSQNVDIYRGDIVIVGTSPGHDVGFVSLTGKMAYLQFRRKVAEKYRDRYDWQSIFRVANTTDKEKWDKAREREIPVMKRARQIVKELALDMKISEVEFRGDNAKATFYYIADQRVDFRELIKRYASEFRIKVEMKQIGHRQEAAMVGGIGSCGRELCCSSWKTDFTSISTSMAVNQGLSPNAEKLAGSCGKLKCCLVYELDSYLEAQKDFPRELLSLELAEGNAYHLKTDILNKKITYSFAGRQENFVLDLAKVKEVIQKNKIGRKPSLSEMSTIKHLKEKEVEAENNMFNQNLMHMDMEKTAQKRQRPNSRNRNKNKNRNRNKQGQSGNSTQGNKRPEK